jgi:putative Holliday junction resolvase
MHLLGIDYGRRHVGIAVATTPLADPVAVVPTQDSLNYVEKLINEYAIAAIVIGLSEGNLAQETQQFARRLQKKSKLPVYYQDETLSSYETRRQAAEAQIKRSRREGKLDHVVAAHILQAYIDTHPEAVETPKT